MPKTISRTIRIPLELDAVIRRDILSEDYKLTDFILDAVHEKMNNRNKTGDLVINSLHSLCESQDNVTRDLNVLFRFMDTFVQFFFFYTPEIPKEMMKEALHSAGTRHRQFFDRFIQNTLTNNKSFVFDTFREEYKKLIGSEMSGGESE